MKDDSTVYVKGLQLEIYTPKGRFKLALTRAMAQCLAASLRSSCGSIGLNDRHLVGLGKAVPASLCDDTNANAGKLRLRS